LLHTTETVELPLSRSDEPNEAESGAALREETTRARPTGGRSPGWRSVLLVVCLALGLAGWWYANVVRASIGPLLTSIGLGQLVRQDAPATGRKQGNADKAVDTNAVTLDAEDQRKLGVALGQAERRRIVKSVRVPGNVAFDERHVTRLRARTQGRVLSLAVQPGDRVEAGMTLATLDASGVLDARNGLAAARAALGEAKAGENVAEIALKRGTDLLKFGGIAQAEVDKRQVDLAKARAAVQSAQAQVELYTAQYERLAPATGAAPGTSAIVSPIAGVVTSANVTLGEVIDTTRDAFTVADASQMLVFANLFGHDIGAVKAGDPVRIEAPVTGHPRFDGRVQSVNAALDPATNTAPARIELANPAGQLKANMLVSVEIEADLGREGATIPATAVQQSEEGPIAFVRVADDRFERRKLRLGLQRADWVEVKHGVAEGENVATDGSFALKAMLMRSLLD